MKLNFGILLLLTTFLFGCSINKSQDENKIFLDFQLGMSESEYLSIRDTLYDNDIIYKKKSTYAYDFVLFDGEQTVEIDEYIDNGELRSLRLNFGFFPSDYYSRNSKFGTFCKRSNVREVYYLYASKYGEPKLENEDDNQVCFWENGHVIITFDFGTESKFNESYTENAYIEYEFEYEYEEQRDTEIYRKSLKKNKEMI